MTITPWEQDPAYQGTHFLTEVRMTVRHTSSPTIPEHGASDTPMEVAESLASDLNDLVPEFIWVPEVRRIPDKQGYGIPLTLGHLDKENDAEWVLEFLFMGIDPFSYKKNQNEPTLKYGPVPADRHCKEETSHPVLDWSWIGTKSLEEGTTYPSKKSLEESVEETRDHILSSLGNAEHSMDILRNFNRCLQQ